MKTTTAASFFMAVAITVILALATLAADITVPVPGEEVVTVSQTADTYGHFRIIIEPHRERIHITCYRGYRTDGVFNPVFRESLELTNATDADGKPVEGQQWYDMAIAQVTLAGEPAANGFGGLFLAMKAAVEAASTP